MAKTLIAFYSRRGENWVDGSVRFLPKGNNEVIVEKIKSQLPEADVFQIETVKKYSDDYMVCIGPRQEYLPGSPLAPPERRHRRPRILQSQAHPGEHRGLRL